MSDARLRVLARDHSPAGQAAFWREQVRAVGLPSGLSRDWARMLAFLGDERCREVLPFDLDEDRADHPSWVACDHLWFVTAHSRRTWTKSLRVVGAFRSGRLERRPCEECQSAGAVSALACRQVAHATTQCNECNKWVSELGPEDAPDGACPNDCRGKPILEPASLEVLLRGRVAAGFVALAGWEKEHERGESLPSRVLAAAQAYVDERTETNLRLWGVASAEVDAFAPRLGTRWFPWVPVLSRNPEYEISAAARLFGDPLAIRLAIRDAVVAWKLAELAT